MILGSIFFLGLIQIPDEEYFRDRCQKIQEFSQGYGWEAVTEARKNFYFIWCV